ncbi:uncharacterized protein SEPMUDRAFT_61970 [Sphaerulina musiva SO2202]|uniref:BZIP domain-containing protein n=1 Tax=Sphaerulina musiva (strain SO2202) TaxID=692275 RepID=M3C142_SPHMS|nr:uncharacterized protein SEPMUDRAFT_61970 [Sphaerulina musiva SO2202]EMF14011.1 hypothetical protein SEPMUDRAFT_61970 [Sphaerulina musiva SO2202]
MDARTQSRARSTTLHAPPPPSTRKRKARSSRSAEEGDSGDDGKKRGRPRVDKHDESAADRRRTQIRMAQRAYRQRKESTLEELRKRVSELTNTVELMNKAFTDHYDRLFLLGLPSRHLQDVRETAEHFENLMKGMRNPCEHSLDDPPAKSQRESTSSIHGSSTEQYQTTMEPRNVPSWIDRSAILEQQQPKPQDPASVGLGYTLYMPEPEEMEDVEQECFAPLDPTSTALTSPSSLELPRQPQQRQSFELFPQEIPEYPSIPASPTPPRTYSFQETTFGRRLHRAALEQGYQLLLNPQRRPATYDRVFRLSLMSRSRDKVLAHMKMMLERGPHESLDQDTPLIHVGGAGTHYPRRRAFGHLSSSPKDSCWHMGIIGPQNLALLENAAKDNIAVDMTVEIAGFEGEWLDPYDVEGYLEEKGILLDPASSFAAVEVLLPPSRHVSDSKTTHSTSPYVAEGGGVVKTPSSNSVQQHRTTPPTAPRPFDREQLFHLHSMGIDASAYDSAANLITTTTTVITSSTGPCSSSTVGVSDPSSLTGTGSWMHFFPQPGGEGGEGTQWTKKTIIIDVAKFLKILIVSGVCLSRTPGYTRRDVDRALALASFDAF